MTIENPYWTSEGQAHFINLDIVNSLCFDLISLFEASRSLAEEMTNLEYADEEPADLNSFPLAKLHMEMSFKKSSELLLQLAILVRTYDDQMTDYGSAEYIDHVNMCNANTEAGVTPRGALRIREACNKLIHAKEVRPLYEKTDKYVIDSTNEAFDGDIWYLTGEIELSGAFRSKQWDVVLHVQPFLEGILSLISFGYHGTKEFDNPKEIQEFDLSRSVNIEQGHKVSRYIFKEITSGAFTQVVVEKTGSVIWRSTTELTESKKHNANLEYSRMAFDLPNSSAATKSGTVSDAPERGF